MSVFIYNMKNFRGEQSELMLAIGVKRIISDGASYYKW